MEPGDAEVRREVRTVEIGTALLLGGLIAVVPSVVLWLVGLLVGVGSAGWDSARRAVPLAAIAVGVAVAVWWLLWARRRGL
jgi:uncharacterized membrane protein